MTATLPKVAVIGRQNVGKSTLVNRLFGRRETIAHEMPGVTRDRVEVQTTWRDRTFALIDTGGYTRVARGIESLVASQADRAAAEADLILLVVDAQAGVTEEDAILARRLRRSTVPVLLVANKADGEREEADVAALYALGLGEPLPVSALHGRGAGDLLDRVVQLLPAETPVERSEEARPEPRFALVGRPNVGKSSIFNALVGEERSVVYQEAGTTRDSVDALLEWADGPVRLVDTAGMRRQTRVTGVEYYGFVRATRAIERADVAVAVIEAPEGFTSEDKKIVVRVLDAGRGLLIAANKWDLVEDKDRTFKRLSEQAALFANATIMRTSATRGQGVHRLPPLLMDLHVRWAHRVST
ncbi:MAG: ribosome biogenesis GTPase Der, partial [Actinomycetota bacterium]